MIGIKYDECFLRFSIEMAIDKDEVVAICKQVYGMWFDIKINVFGMEFWVMVTKDDALFNKANEYYEYKRNCIENKA